jgi:hypothetical protein
MAPPPLLGFNNNVRHRGRIFHIQTEDSGIQHPRVVTHLFADGGRIIKTTRTDYAEHVGRVDMPKVVRALMKEQHKAMFISLRAGDLDRLLEQVTGPLEPVAAESASTSGEAAPAAPEPATPELAAPGPPAFEPAKREPEKAAPASSHRPLSNPSLRKMTPSVAPPPPEAFDMVDGLPNEPAQRSRPKSSRPKTKKSDRPVRKHQSSGRYAAARPAAIFSEPPKKGSLFGPNVISEKSLDEVILSYLAEELEETEK